MIPPEPLREITTIQAIILPPNARNFGFFRGESQLARISFKYDQSAKGPAQTAADFWAQQDAAGQTSR